MNFKSSSFQVPEDWVTIKTIDMHTGGEPLRVILDGFPELEGNSVLEYRSFINQKHDHLRTALMFEPRGHADMYGVIVTPSDVADFGVVFTHNEGYSTMCGHATIAIAKLAIEAKWVEVHEPETRITIEAPCGVLTAFVKVENGKSVAMRFQNVPSFVVSLDQEVEIPELGRVTYDLAYGGAYYAFVQAKDVGLECTPEYFQDFIRVGMKIKKAVMDSQTISHPLEEDLSFLYGTIFIGDPHSKDSDSRNVCIFADGEVDRSPTGSGVSARAAIHHARGELKLGEFMTIESIIGSTFQCGVIETVDYHGIAAVVPEVHGTAYVVGKNEWVIDPSDPLKDGFILR